MTRQPKHFDTLSGTFTSKASGRGGHRFLKQHLADLHTTVPGPAAYDTRINSCIQSPEKQTSIGKAKRFKAALPDHSPVYDTRPAVHLLRKVVGGGTMTRAERKIQSHLFAAKNSGVIVKGIHML
jgi:hypothetical protein